MFNIAIEQYPGKMIYVSHNNPTINNMSIVGKALAKFRYEKNIDPNAFVSHLMLTISRCDSKKNPVFYIGISTILGENSGAIVGVSIPNSKIGFYNENGQPCYQLYDTYEFISFSERQPENNQVTNPAGVNLLRSENPPETFNFTSMGTTRLM